MAVVVARSASFPVDMTRSWSWPFVAVTQTDRLYTLVSRNGYDVQYQGIGFGYGPIANAPPTSGVITSLEFRFEETSNNSSWGSYYSISGLSVDAVTGFDSYGGYLAPLLAGNDLIYGSDLTDPPPARGPFDEGVSDMIWGYAGNDVIVLYGASDFASGGDGNDYIYAGAGDDSAVGDSGNDVLLGEDGNDGLNGGAGSNYLFGGNGDDVLVGGTGGAVLDGVNVLYGGAGADKMYGGGGTNYFYGGAGADKMTGGPGIDIFIASGESEGDDLWGGDGRDYFYCSNGADQVHAGAGVDVILAAGGDDVIDAGLGVDYAWGGAGNDTYIINATTNGVIVINDFAAGGAEDAVQITSATVTTFAQAQAAMTYVAGINTTIVTLDADTAVWFIGVNTTQLMSADFIFV